MRSKPPPHVSNLRWSIVPALAGPLEPHERIPNAPEDRNIADPAIAKKVEEELAAGKLWPDPLLQFNPAYESAGAVADVRRIVASRTLGRRSSPARDGGFRPVERRNPARGSCRKAAGVPLVVLNERMETNHGHLSVATMHLAKGLEFRAVAVMACDDAVIPLQERIESVADESDLDEVYQTERHLLYVACTRARDHLMVRAVAPGSEFIADLQPIRPN